MELKIRLFGKAKEFSQKGVVDLACSEAICVSDLRLALVDYFSKNQDREVVMLFVNDCALGSAEKILSEKDLIEGDQELVLLPPVCGG